MTKIVFSNKNLEGCPIRFLEHVQIRITLSTPRRGNVRVFLVSPPGKKHCLNCSIFLYIYFQIIETLSVLMHPRNRDNSVNGFTNWNLTSVQYWGENPIGDWTLFVQNSVGYNKNYFQSFFIQFYIRDTKEVLLDWTMPN